MDLFIAGRAKSADRVCFNDAMGFGQFRRLPGQPQKPTPVYEMVFDRQEFIDLFAEAYSQICQEARQEDEATNDTSVFSEIDYPPLSKALDHQPQITEIVEWFLARDHIFPKCLSRTTWRHVVNSVDEVTADEKVRIKGRCRLL